MTARARISAWLAVGAVAVGAAHGVRISDSYAEPASRAGARSGAIDLSAPDLGAPVPRDLHMRGMRDARGVRSVEGVGGEEDAGGADEPRTRTRVAAAQPAELTDILSGVLDDDDARNRRDPRRDRAGDADDDAGDETRIRARPDARDVAAGEPLADKVVFRFNIGLALDGGEPTGDRRLLSGISLDDQRYARLRVYNFGDAIIGSRGIITSSLSTYFAAQFRFDQRLDVPGQDDVDSNPIPSIHDADHVRDILIRSAYAETDRMFDNRFLAPLYVRAGRQFRYGPAIAHFDGATAGYDTRTLSVGGFLGRRVELYRFPYADGALPDGEDDGTTRRIAGADARVDFFELQRVPLVLSGSWLRFDDDDHVEGTVALKWSRDVSLNASVRLVEGALARERVHLSARVSKVTTVSVEVDNRQSDDWVYDLLFRAPAQSRADPRSYLNLGPPVPRIFFDLRAGTVLFRNIDVLIRGGAALENPDEGGPTSTYSASYAEAGLGAEVRVRRTLVVGGSVLGRIYDRGEFGVGDVVRFPDIADATSPLGERGFVESGLTFRLSQGARSFSATMELFARYVEYPPQPTAAEAATDFRGGGRFSVEGWAGDNLRLKGEYEVTSSLAPAPELAGLKSLRVLAEAQF